MGNTCKVQKEVVSALQRALETMRAHGCSPMLRSETDSSLQRWEDLGSSDRCNYVDLEVTRRGVNNLSYWLEGKDQAAVISLAEDLKRIAIKFDTGDGCPDFIGF